jgi:hypothetical protein
MAIMRTGFAEIRNRFNFSAALKAIDCQAVLDYYGARNCEERRNGRDGTTEIIHSCLLDAVEPHHASGDEKPSASMNVDKATYHCYSYWQGGIFDFLKKMEQTEELNGIIGVLQQVLGDAPTSGADRSDVIAQLESLLRPRGDSASLVEGPRYSERAIAAWAGVRHPYATEERSLNDRSYDLLQLGYDAESRRLVFPHWVGGRLVGWQKRAIPDRPGRWAGSVDELPKYKSNPSFPKSSTLYHADGQGGAGPTIVVESPMSVARAVSLGLDNVVATFGAGLGDAQLDRLRELFPLILWFDADPAGYKAEIRACEELAKHGPVSVVRPETGKDLADYATLEEINTMIASARPAVLAMMEHRRRITR